MHDGQQNPTDPADPRSPDDLYVGDIDSPDYDADLLDAHDMPAWPKVIGTLSIVFGSVSVLCGGVQFGFNAFILPQLVPAETWEGAATPPPIVSIPPEAYVAGVLSIIVNVGLVVAGVMCAARNAAGRMAHLIYGVVMVIVTIYSTLVQMRFQESMDQWVADNPDTTLATQMASQSAFNSIGLIFFIILTLAWPAFCIIWFGMVKRKPEDFTGGVEVVA